MYLKTSKIVPLNSGNLRVNLGSGESCGKALAFSLITIRYWSSQGNLCSAVADFCLSKECLSILCTSQPWDIQTRSDVLYLNVCVHKNLFPNMGL